MIIAISLIILSGISIYIFVHQPMFGKIPSGERLERIKRSPNYRNGQFQNQNPTPVLAEDVGFFKMMKMFWFERNKSLSPEDEVPSVKTDLLNLDPNEDILIWFGHSSYFIQIDGKKCLADPVFSPTASPVSFSAKAFKGSSPYTTDDIPEIDYLFITHDHWDHLDYKTVMKLKPKIKKVICSLGVGEHFEHWDFERDMIIEGDWNDLVLSENGFKVYTVPARHFSGRLQRNKSLWTAFVLETPLYKIFIGGDGGYDTHFAEIGKTFGEFDLVLLDNGQHNKYWKYIHMMPDEVLQAGKDLNAKRLLPGHSGKFAIANHAWDEPLKQITALNKDFNLNLITPIIGEPVILKNTSQKFSRWWELIR